MTQQKEARFSPGEPACIQVTNIRGSVLIEAGSASEIWVEAKLDPESGNPDRTRVEISQASDGTVVAETKFHKGLSGVLGRRGDRPCRVDYHVRVPPACNVRLEAVSSTAELRSLSGELSVNTVSGDLTLQDLNGTLKAGTISGSMQINHLKGGLHLKTVSGRVDVIASELSSVEGTTVSGEFHLGGSLAGGPFRVESVSGGLTLAPAGEQSLHLTLQSLSGRLIPPPDIPVERPRPGWQEARVQGGQIPVHLTSVSGSLVLAGSASAQGDVRESRERLDVLERLERGELSVDEALESMAG